MQMHHEHKILQFVLYIPDNYDHNYLDDPELGDSPDGWKNIAYDLAEGDHTFTFTATDSYDESATTQTTLSVRREPDAKPASVEVIHENLKYITVKVSDNNLCV
jgi:hypothetical protein